MGCGVDLSDLLKARRPAPPAPPPPKQEIHYHYEGDRSVKITDSVVSRSNLSDEGSISPATGGTGKDSRAPTGTRASAPGRTDRVIQSCPHCGETLELPAPPRYCPYCTAGLTVD